LNEKKQEAGENQFMITEGEQQIDSAIEAVGLIDKTLKEVRDTIQNITNQLREKDEELKHYRTEIEELNKKINEQQQELEAKDKSIKELETGIKEKEEEIEALTKDLEAVKERSAKREEEIRKMEEENREMKKELQGIQEQLSKISSMYQELSKQKEEAINVRELLTIYVTLLEEVFAGLPHARILWLLHGARNVLTREELTKTSGFQPATVLKSIYDLQSAKLVEYDMDTQNVKLIRKLY